MERKICNKCKEEKGLCDFYNYKKSKDGKRTICKKCMNKINSEYVNNNREKVKKIKDKYVNNNKDKVKMSKQKWEFMNPDYKKNHYTQNKDTYIKNSLKNYNKNKDSILKKRKIYYNDNKENIFLSIYEKYRKNPLFRLKISVRNRIRVFLKNKNTPKKNKTFDIIGCDPIFLKEFLEKKFFDGMSWDNYGLYGWHIDHIIPLSSAKNEEEMLKLCHYTNLQPLWSKDNLKKSNKIIFNSHVLNSCHNDETFRVQQESIIKDHL